MPRVESINEVAVRYVDDTWALEGVAWLEQDAVQAIGLYNWKRYPYVKALVYFTWVSPWDTEREIWERVLDLPKAASPITPPGIVGHVALIGADRWAVARALPMAVESLMGVDGVREWPMELADVSAWTCADGWQAASGASMLECAGKPFSTSLFAAPLDRFVWPRSQRRLGRTRLATIIKGCPWTRRDAPSLYETLGNMAQYSGASIAHFAALAGKSDKDRTNRKCIMTLLNLGLARQAGTAGVAAMGTSEKPEAFSERGRGQTRYRLSMGPKGEDELPRRQPAESKEDDARRTANGGYLLMLAHGGLSFREVVRRSGLSKIKDRLSHRLVHDVVVVDLLGRFRVMGCEVLPASRAKTVNKKGYGIDPDGMVYCISPAGTGCHYLELEFSHLGPTAIRLRLKKYKGRLTSYPLAAVCKTDLAAQHYDRIGQELGVPVVATSLRRLKAIGFSGPAWLHHGEEVCISPVPCPPRPEAP